MLDVYLICAGLGGTILIVQLVLNLLGFGHHDAGGFGDHDAGFDDHQATHETQGHAFLGILSFRTIVAAVAFFGLAGIAAGRNGAGTLAAAGIATVAGLAAMCGVAAVMKFFTRLHRDGTARIEQSLGASGSVYLTIPANRSGAGKISVAVQDRTMEYLAVTAGGELTTGTNIVVVDIIGPDTVEVEAHAAPEAGTEEGHRQKQVENNASASAS
jgi:hypothetical protein